QTLKQAILSGMLRFITSRYDAYPLRIQVQRGRHADGLRRHGIRHDPRAPRFRSDPHTPECARPALPVAPSTLVAVALLPPHAPQDGSRWRATDVAHSPRCANPGTVGEDLLHRKNAVL